MIAHDSKCSRPISVVRCIVQGRSQEFVDVRNLVMGYVMGYLSTISEKTFGVVRTGSSEHEIDKHPLRSKHFREGSLSSVIDCPAMDLGELKARSHPHGYAYV